MIFRVRRLRVTLIAVEPLTFPAAHTGNVLRGALGLALRAVAPPPVYQRLFEPVSVQGPSGLADQPRPFVLRAAPQPALLPGEQLPVAIHLFDPAAPPYFAEAFRRIETEGLGKGRGAVRVSVAEEPTIAIALDRPVPAQRIRIVFESPMELKSAGKIVAEPAFDVLYARIRDRISTLRALYQDGPLPIDFREAGERAAAIRLTASELRYASQQRRSTRTGQEHPLGGFTGWAEYQGELSEFMPYLEAAAWTGAGRQTVWGKGAIATGILA